MSIQLPQQSMLPSISSITLDDSDTEFNEQEQPIIPKPETLEQIKEEESIDPSEAIAEILNEDNDNSLPKDVGEINVKGYLRFDEEMPPDEETQLNTECNARMYQLCDSTSKDGIHHLRRNQNHILSFDTYNPNLDASLYQMTIVHEHKQYHYKNTSRTFLVPLDNEKPSLDAITWTLGEMVNDNDIVVVIKIIPLQTVIKNGVQSHRSDCKELFNNVCKLNCNMKKLKIIVEIRIGAVEYSLARALRDFDPTVLIMGTKGIKKTKLSNFLNEDTSVTKHFLDNGTLPVIIINPNYQPKDKNKDTAKTADDGIKYSESSFSKQLMSYTSVYDPLNGAQAFAMERSTSGENSVPRGRPTRFLKIGKTMTRSNSSSSINSTASTDKSPSRGLSPMRALSPFKLFHSSRPK